MPCRAPLFLTLFGAALLAACATGQPGRALQTATAATSRTLCSAVFVSGRDADTAYREEVHPDGGMALVDWAVRYDVDRAHGEVRVTLGTAFAARSVHQADRGCTLVHDGDAVAIGEPAPAVPDTTTVATAPGLAPVLADTFAADTPERHTHAIVVMHRGRVVAERYAPGLGPGNRLHGHSLSKSVLHALFGVLVRDGRVVMTPALDQLFRMTSGLPRDGGLGGFDDASRMWFIERNMAAFAATLSPDAAPGTRWAYSEAGYMRLSKVLADTVGRPANVRAFAQRDLFGPVGMPSALIEFDAAGTPIAGSQVFATARDWARLGQLYLDDGVAGGRRVLPEGWVAAARTPTLDAGYGAGFWLNHRHAPGPGGVPWGLPGVPADAFFARGYLGQFVVVVPSRQVVVARLGVTHLTVGDPEGIGRLVAAVLAALDD